MDTDRWRRVLAMFATVSLLLAACGSDDDGGPEGLGDIRDSSPAGDETDDSEPTDETDESPATDDDGDDEAADASAESDDDQADVVDEVDEPIPGVFVPSSAFQINDDLDLTSDEQLEYLEFALEAFLYTTNALNTGDWDEVELARYYAETELEQAIEGFQYYEAHGLRQVNDGTTILFVRVASIDGDTAILHRCIENGPEDGVIDVVTGEYTVRVEQTHWLSEQELRTHPSEGSSETEYRILRGGEVPDVPCP